MVKKPLLYIGAFALVASVGGVIAQNSFKNLSMVFTRSSQTEYVIELDQNNVPNDLTGDYQNTFSDTVSTKLGHNVKLTFVNAKTLSNGFAQLANHGKIYNYESDDNQLTGVVGVELVGSGSLLFKPCAAKGYLADIDPITINAGAGKVTVPACDYFEMEAGDSGASITNLKLTYSCDAEATDVKLLNGIYTGIGADHFIYKLTVNNGSVSIASLDKQTNDSLSGTVQMMSKTQAKCTFVYNTYNIYYTMNFDGHGFTFVSKTDDVGGAAAGAVTQISTLDRVYNVEDFESYSATGTGYVSADAKYTTTGLRSQYYADYYTGSSSGEIGGSGWPIMTSTDNSNWRNDKGYNGSKGGIFKFSNGMGMRYISMNELYGVKAGMKGTTLSFWAKGAYTNTNFNTYHANNTEMKMYAYYGSPLTPSNQTTVRETFDFTVQAGSTWQHFEMPLTAGRTYYGFGFYAKQQSGSTQYVPFDNIMIYTASPYAEYVAPVAVTGVSVSPSQLELTTGGTGSVAATITPSDATNKNVTWTSSNTSVATVAADGTVTAVAEGNATITATTADGGFTATCAVTVSDPVIDYPEGTFKGTAVVSGGNYGIVISVGRQGSNLVAVRLSNKDAVATGITFNNRTNGITITTTGDYNGYSYGNITGTYDKANNCIKNVSCSGQVSAAVSNNGSITCDRIIASGSDHVFADCDGTTSELQSQFKRRYMSGSWQVDNSNADRITSNTTEFVCGTGSVKRRGYSGGAVALNFQNDFASAVTVKNVQFWVYNPSGSNITLRMWGYKGTNFGSNFETGSVTATAGQWTYVAMGFTEAAIYNFQIADFNNTGVYLSFDNIYIF